MDREDEMLGGYESALRREKNSMEEEENVFSVTAPFLLLCNLSLCCCEEGRIYRDGTDSFEVEEDGYVDKKNCSGGMGSARQYGGLCRCRN